MKDASIDYEAVFKGLPGMVALLTPELVYADVNEDFLRISGRTREQVVGRYIFDVFPENPDNPTSKGMHNVQTSMRRVVATGERDTMALQRYDVESPERPGQWEERYWSPVNAPVFGPDGKVVLVVHRVEEVTELIRARGGPTGAAPGCWRPSCTRAAVNSRNSTTGCARPTPASARSHSPSRRRCSPPAARSATSAPRSATVRPSAH